MYGGTPVHILADVVIVGGEETAKSTEGVGLLQGRILRCGYSSVVAGNVGGHRHIHVECSMELMESQVLRRIIRADSGVRSQSKDELLRGARHVDGAAGPGRAIPTHRMGDHEATGAQRVRVRRIKVGVDPFNDTVFLPDGLGVAVRHATAVGEVGAVRADVGDEHARVGHAAAEADAHPRVRRRGVHVVVDVAIFDHVEGEDEAGLGEGVDRGEGIGVDGLRASAAAGGDQAEHAQYRGEEGPHGGSRGTGSMRVIDSSSLKLGRYDPAEERKCRAAWKIWDGETWGA